MRSGRFFSVIRGAIAVMGVVCVAGASACVPPTTRPPTFASLGDLALDDTDVTRPHELPPKGVPLDSGWAIGPRIQGGTPDPGWSAAIPWGHVYPCASSLVDESATFEIDDMRLYLLDVSGRWWTWTTTTYDGGAWTYDYADGTRADIVTSGSRGISTHLVAGRNFHFWRSDDPHSGRVAIPTGVVAAAAAYRIRMAPGSTGTPCLLAGAGVDWWRSLTALPDSGSNGDAGIGRFKRVGQSWRAMISAGSSATRSSKRASASSNSLRTYERWTGKPAWPTI